MYLHTHTNTITPTAIAILASSPIPLPPLRPLLVLPVCTSPLLSGTLPASEPVDAAWLLGRARPRAALQELEALLSELEALALVQRSIVGVAGGPDLTGSAGNAGGASVERSGVALVSAHRLVKFFTAHTAARDGALAGETSCPAALALLNGCAALVTSTGPRSSGAAATSATSTSTRGEASSSSGSSYSSRSDGSGAKLNLGPESGGTLQLVSARRAGMRLLLPHALALIYTAGIDVALIDDVEAATVLARIARGYFSHCMALGPSPNTIACIPLFERVVSLQRGLGPVEGHAALGTCIRYLGVVQCAFSPSPAATTTPMAPLDSNLSGGGEAFSSSSSSPASPSSNAQRSDAVAAAAAAASSSETASSSTSQQGDQRGATSTSTPSSPKLRRSASGGSVASAASARSTQPHAPSPRALLEEAVAIHRQIWPDGHQELANSLSILGVYHFNNGALDAAQPLLDEALSLRRRLWPSKDHGDLALSLHDSGALCRAKGDRKVGQHVQ